MNRGEIYRFKGPRRPRGHEQAGERFGVVLQADDLSVLSTVIVAPTSTSAPAQPFRPAINVGGRRTRVLLEQLAAIDHSRLGDPAGALSRRELEDVELALRAVLGLAA